MTICEHCGRTFKKYNEYYDHAMSSAVYVYVVFEYYGCDTGCTGHKGYVCDAEGHILASQFEFTHPCGDDKQIFIREFVASCGWSHIPVDYDKCEVHDE